MAIIVDKAVLLEIKIPAPGLIKPNVGVLVVEADPTRFSVIINNTFFSFRVE